MGNCLRRESSIQSGGDDWGSPVPDKFKRHEKIMDMEEKGLLRDHNDKDLNSSTTSSKSSTEVKIKISKKQLQELLGRVDMKELSLEQVLAQLMMNVSNTTDQYETHQRSWKPNLQSIPE